MCMNWKVLGALGVVAIGILIFAPSTLGSAAPLLLLAACPLSMLVMMIVMGKRANSCETDNGGHSKEIDALRSEVESLRRDQSQNIR